jgi:hypothetical protein
MSAKLLERANAHRAGFKVKESVPGSGHHDNDRNPTRPDLFVAPHRKPHPTQPGQFFGTKCSEQLVAFFDHSADEEVHFVGPDADKALACVKAWLAKNAKGDLSNAPGTVRALAMRIAPKLAVRTVDGQPRLTVRLSAWNDVLHAIQAEGQDVLGLPLEE